MILAALAEGAATGYGVGRLLRGELAHLRTAQLQQVYSELACLKAEGLVTAERLATAGRGLEKKLYAITPPGRRALAAWLVRPPRYSQAKDDLLVHLYCLRQETRRLVARRLEERRERYEAWLEVLRHRLEEAGQPNNLAGLGYALTLEAAILTMEAQVQWCEGALARVRSFST